LLWISFKSCYKGFAAPLRYYTEQQLAKKTICVCSILRIYKLRFCFGIHRGMLLGFCGGIHGDEGNFKIMLHQRNLGLMLG
jgi:hypothetical protein